MTNEYVPDPGDMPKPPNHLPPGEEPNPERKEPEPSRQPGQPAPDGVPNEIRALDGRFGDDDDEFDERDEAPWEKTELNGQLRNPL